MEPVTVLETAVTGTNVYKTRVQEQGKRRCYFAAKMTSTTGTLRSWINNLSRADYEKAVAAAAGADRAAKEATNVTGWELESFAASDVPTGETVAAGGEIAMTGADATSAVNANLPPGPCRRRLEFTNATGSGTVKITRRFV